jgi:hypothetical protein
VAVPVLPKGGNQIERDFGYGESCSQGISMNGISIQALPNLIAQAGHSIGLQPTVPSM